MQRHQQKVYLIQVSGIKCTNCAGKIERGLGELKEKGVLKVTVNIIQEKISITVQNEQVMSLVIQKLELISFPAIGDPILLSGGNQSERSFTILFQHQNQAEKSVDIMRMLTGVVKYEIQAQHKNKVSLIYNSLILKGREITNLLDTANYSYQIINQKVQSFQGNNQVLRESLGWKATLTFITLLMTFNMVLPMSGEWFDSIVGYPEVCGVLPVSVCLNILVALFVLWVCGRKYIINAYINYMSFNETNMETLIGLGCMSSLFLSFFWIFIHTQQLMNHQLNHRIMAIHEINDSLTSSSIIVLVVTLGKYLEYKIKKKIARISGQIFPQSVLFKEMGVEVVELKNRRLMISSKKMYDVTVVQKGDILDLKKGRLLVDVIIIDGQIRATQSALDGSEEVVTLGKGQRIQSGSIIHENMSALVQVENNFEKSLLVQIGMQVKLSQNVQDERKSGIQAVCQTIAGFFVRLVVSLSLLTMFVWSVILYLEMTSVPIPAACWVIERGISVLVASCPCALGLAIPTVVAIVLNMATKRGILIRNNGVFESMKNCKIVAFDKTGTLFTKIKKIEESQVLSKTHPQTHLWQIIALIEKQIQHPIAEVLYKEAFIRSQVTGTNFNFIITQKPTLTKEGLSATVRSKTTQLQIDVKLGNKFIMTQNNIRIPSFHKTTDSATQLFLSLDGEVCLLLCLNTHSNLRPQAQRVIQMLQSLKKQVHILSGDSCESVGKIGTFLGVKQSCLHAQHSAFMKMQWIKNQQKQGLGVLMVGDGLNDIPCLQEASIGVSINSKSELNINAANVVILSQNLTKIVTLIRMLERGNKFIIINLFWAFAYNIFMMPIVAGAFYWCNFYVSPMWSSIAMSSSSIIVVLFSNLLSYFKYEENLEKQDNKKQSNLDKSAQTHRSLNIMREQMDQYNLNLQKKGSAHQLHQEIAL